MCDSLRGRKGGHKLAKPASEITVGEIVALWRMARLG